MNRDVVNANQGQASSYYPSTAGSEVTSWPSYKVDDSSTENGIHSNSTYQYSQSIQQPVSSSSSSLGTVNATQEYNGYSAYNPSDPYGYGSTGYSSYYNNGYQQQSQSNPPSYTQPVGAHQSSGAPPYQPLSSFQSSGSYTGSASYSSSSTYYNPGDYQTSGGYPSSGYNNQTTQWSDATNNYTNYNSQQYTNYHSGASDAYSSGTATAASADYQQQYKQWTDYYNQTEVTCAPGTEKSSVSGTSNYASTAPTFSSGYPTLNSQPPLPPPPPPPPQQPQALPPPPPLPVHYTPQSWRPDSISSELPLAQSGAVANDAHDAYWRHVAPTSQNHHAVPVQPQAHKPLDQNYSYNSFHDQQKYSYTQDSGSQYPSNQQVSTVSSFPPGPTLQYPASHQVLPEPQTNQPPPQSVRVSKMQIPTNPRIASNLTFGLPNTDMDSSTAAAVAVSKPAYISVSVPKPNDNVSSISSADIMLKPGMFPKSLRGYVERALARCKDDLEMAACQAVMKEMITKATADGTLYTRDWDIEPLFAMPNADVVKQESATSLGPFSSLEKVKRSPTRRSKSRWEPLPEQKVVENPVSINHDTSKYSVWVNERSRKMVGMNTGSKVDNFSGTRFSSPPEQKSSNKFTPKQVKRQRLMDNVVATTSGDGSGDSDKEQTLTAYYAGAMALADSPEEIKRRESRSKRFDKGQRRETEANHFKAKGSGTRNLYTKRASAMMLSKNFEDSGSRAVEDIDWDSLTVKGTCQEIEKRYLRLTSAPDPASVRPEEILEKALLMVQTSQKSYLYKCDQLKSIRQDLTVQRIRNYLTVKVYETHARLALEVGDLPEYNQCQSQLKSLYAEGNEGCYMEFAAYNLLCVIMHSNNHRDLVSSMSRLSDAAKKDDAVKHALAVRGAVTLGNYITFFRLYKTAPNLNTCLMDMYVEKMRFRAVKCMARSYRPTLPVSYIAQVLGFNSLTAREGIDEKNSDGLEECVEWLKAHGACLVADNNIGEMQLDAKATASTLYMPEPEDAVAHGDASLAVNDFMTRTATT